MKKVHVGIDNKKADITIFPNLTTVHLFLILEINQRLAQIDKKYVVIFLSIFVYFVNLYIYFVDPYA